jgi:hypothetical protein
MGTTYEITGDPSIATINADGVIKGLKEGNGTLIVRNGNISTTAKIMVWQFTDNRDPESEPRKGGGGGCNAYGYLTIIILGAVPFFLGERNNEAGYR